MKNKKIIVWALDIDALFEGTSSVGGITVQMSLWASAFRNEGWMVYCPSNYCSKDLHQIHFRKYWKLKRMNWLLTPLFVLNMLFRVRPEVVISRGATRNLFFFVLFAKFFRVKIIELLASDTDVMPGKELIGVKWDQYLFRAGMRMCSMFVVQNLVQQQLLKQNYGKSALLIPNVWETVGCELESQSPDIRKTILWVANFRGMKRPKWLLDIAQAMPQHQFVMVGASLDDALYARCRERAEKLSNVELTGGLSLKQTNARFREARLLVCTSEFEGFPNTYLQAWANKIPVITTCDPSDLIRLHELGHAATSREELIAAIGEMDDPTTYRRIEANISDYFVKNHDLRTRYDYMTNEFGLR